MLNIGKKKSQSKEMQGLPGNVKAPLKAMSKTKGIVWALRATVPNVSAGEFELCQPALCGEAWLSTRLGRVR